MYDEVIGPIGMHISSQMQVLLNPMVAYLPQHVHLFAGEGCMDPDKSSLDQLNNIDGGVPCEGLDSLPDSYNSLIRCIKDENMRKSLKKSVQDMYWSCFKPKS